MKVVIPFAFFKIKILWQFGNFNIEMVALRVCFDVH